MLIFYLKNTGRSVMTSHFAVPRLADQLGHGPHRAVHTPAAGLEQHHGDQAKNSGGQHHAVKSKGELRHAGMEECSVIVPLPGQLEGPQQRHPLI